MRIPVLDSACEAAQKGDLLRAILHIVAFLEAEREVQTAKAINGSPDALTKECNSLSRDKEALQAEVNALADRAELQQHRAKRAELECERLNTLLRDSESRVLAAEKERDANTPNAVRVIIDLQNETKKLKAECQDLNIIIQSLKKERDVWKIGYESLSMKAESQSEICRHCTKARAEALCEAEAECLSIAATKHLMLEAKSTAERCATAIRTLT